MTILGATTEDLVGLAARLGTTTADIGAVERDTQGIATTVVDEMHVSFSTAVTGITNATNVLRGSVDGARAQLDRTTWTGTNRAVFDGAYADFTAAMAGLEAAITDAYGQFDAQMKQVAGLIEEFQAQVSASMQDAQASTTSMQQAVEAQRENLEMVMNTGLSVG